jgi:DNA-directed RNA polymerase delta subunit
MAYLALKRHGSPMHFGEVAKAISELFNKRAHEATCHNELIKDKRFVLVGRGLYALTEWGYSRGVVKDVIKGVLKDGALSKKDIVERVKRERYVKDGTILVNLQDTKMFKRLDNGDYALTK